MPDQPASRQCPFCKEEIRADAVKCKHCKSVLEPDKPSHGGTCPYCKEAILPEAIKCKHCGSIVGRPASEATSLSWQDIPEGVLSEGHELPSETQVFPGTGGLDDPEDLVSSPSLGGMQGPGETGTAIARGAVQDQCFPRSRVLWSRCSHGKRCRLTITQRICCKPPRLFCFPGMSGRTSSGEPYSFEKWCTYEPGYCRGGETVKAKIVCYSCDGAGGLSA